MVSPPSPAVSSHRVDLSRRARGVPVGSLPSQPVSPRLVHKCVHKSVSRPAGSCQSARPLDLPRNGAREHQIRKNGNAIQDRPLRSVGWVDIPGLSIRGRRRPPSRQQGRQPSLNVTRMSAPVNSSRASCVLPGLHPVLFESLDSVCPDPAVVSEDPPRNLPVGVWDLYRVSDSTRTRTSLCTGRLLVS